MHVQLNVLSCKLLLELQELFTANDRIASRPITCAREPE